MSGSRLKVRLVRIELMKLLVCSSRPARISDNTVSCSVCLKEELRTKSLNFGLC